MRRLRAGTRDQEKSTISCQAGRDGVLFFRKAHKPGWSKLHLGRTATVIASEAQQSRERRAPYGLLDRCVAIARPEGRASFDALWLLAITSSSERSAL